MQHVENHFRAPCRVALTVAACLLAASGIVRAENLPAPDYSIASLPGPAANAFSVSTAFSPSDGLLYVWTGAQVLKQDAPLGETYTPIGNVGSGSSDAGPIAFSRDGSSLLVGNGFGGSQGGANSGLVFGIPSTGGDSNTELADIEFHSSFLAASLGASNDKFFVNQGNQFFTGSSVSVLDRATGSNLPVIANIPGASTSMAVSPGGQLFVGVGFGPQRGEIRAFDLSALEAAYNSATPLDWTGGQVFNAVDNNSGAGMAFDTNGNLWVGGASGVTVFDSLANYQLFDNGGFTAIDYDPIHDLLLVTGWGNHQGLYQVESLLVPEPGTLGLAVLAALAVAPMIRRRRARR